MFKGLTGLTSLWSQDMAIDLGTANTLVVLKDQGVVLNEPSVVAVIEDAGKKSVLAVGDEAKTMLGRTPGNISAIRPLKDGVIADFVAMKKWSILIKVHKKNAFADPRILICVPTGSTPVKKNNSRLSTSGRSKKSSINRRTDSCSYWSWITNIRATGSMVVDIGGGTTEIAVMSLGGVVYSKSLRVAGDALDQSIIAYMRKKMNLMMNSTAEKIKKEIKTIPSTNNTFLMKGRILIRNSKRNRTY